MKNSFLIKTDYNSKAAKIGRITTTQTFRRQYERKCQKTFVNKTTLRNNWFKSDRDKSEDQVKKCRLQ